jgi:hypothetical protein
MTAMSLIVDRETWQEHIDAQRVREKAHTGERMRSPVCAGGCRWSRSTRRRRWSAPPPRSRSSTPSPGAGRSCCVGARSRIRLRCVGAYEPNRLMSTSWSEVAPAAGTAWKRRVSGSVVHRCDAC